MCSLRGSNFFMSNIDMKLRCILLRCNFRLGVVREQFTVCEQEKCSIFVGSNTSRKVE